MPECTLFFEPENAKVGDVIPFFDAETGRMLNYYLKNWNPDAPAERIVNGWHRIPMEGHRVLEERPAFIEGGTGCVLRVDGLYHMFYCSFDFDKVPVAQWVRHAVSPDLEHWTDRPEEKFGPDGKIYRMTDWRDPFVFRNEETEEWWMLVAARENAPTERNGCVGLCVSKDLSHWEYRPPLYADHRNPSAHECPDLFRMGDWYYLLFSEYSDGFGTFYRMSRSPSGPWQRPKVDTFDGRAFYAAKTAFDGEHRYLYGWNPTRGENAKGFDPGKDFGKDYRSWNWGGSLVVHRIVQHGDGTLGVCPPDSLREAFAPGKPMALTPLTGSWQTENGILTGTSDGSFGAVLGEVLPAQCRVQATLTFQGAPERFGLALQVDEGFDFGYYLMFEPDFHRIQFRSGLRMYEDGGQMFPYAVEMERPLDLEAGKAYELDLYLDGTLGLLYVNRDLAFGFRMYNWRNRRLGVFLAGGSLTVSGLRLGAAGENPA